MNTQSGIPEGFPGQHLVVLPPQVRRGAERHPLLRGLCVTDAGVFPRATGHLVERPKGAAATVLIACVAGRGWIDLRGKILEVEAGAWAWLPARQPHRYGSAPHASWTIEWAHFGGDETGAWRELLQLSPDGGVLPPSRDALHELRLGAIWAYLENGYSLANLVAASASLRTTLSALNRRQAPDSSANPSAAERVAASVNWLRSHLAQSIRVEELASMAALSVPHYCAIFKRQTGFAPIDWLIRLRIQRACQLLDTTTENIAAIARQVGFPDPYYFTRSFRRIMGAPPRDYRRVQKG